jgi:DNA helicase-2/ATP-dependent DNA helicase PcrA
MTNKERAEARANEIDEKIIETVQSGHSFRVEAGAGAGKTYSLERVVDWLDREKKAQYRKNGQNVACITYTNAAVDVIAGRLLKDSYIKPSTIHTFAWELINRFQSSMISYVQEMQLLPKKTDGSGELIDISEVKNVCYSLGVRYIEDGTLFLFHDDVIKLFVRLLDHAKFRLILGKKYPIILIDEYQDSFRVIMDQFLKYFIEPGIGPQFGLFGDSWQTIYASQGACGLVESDKLVVINKEANFRSQEVIVNALNQIRPSLPQISASDETDGKIIIITTEEYDGCRIQKGYYKGELEESVLFNCINGVIEKLELGWTGQTKKLMLTHKMLAKQQGYLHVLDLLDEHLKNKDDEHFLFFQNRVEPVYKALVENDPKQLFEALGVERRPVESRQNKRQWREFKESLSAARNETIGSVLKTVAESRLIGIPPKIIYWMNEAKKGEQGKLYHGKSIHTLYDIPYSEILKAIEFFTPEADFSTDHGVKGEQYDNVFLVLGRGWNEYKFDEQLYLDPVTLDDTKRKAYIRNRNLFYVCCSRPKKNLAILVTVPINHGFRSYLERVFGAENIVPYGRFMEERFSIGT